MGWALPPPTRATHLNQRIIDGRQPWLWPFLQVSKCSGTHTPLRCSPARIAATTAVATAAIPPSTCTPSLVLYGNPKIFLGGISAGKGHPSPAVRRRTQFTTEMDLSRYTSPEGSDGPHRRIVRPTNDAVPRYTTAAAIATSGSLSFGVSGGGLAEGQFAGNVPCDCDNDQEHSGCPQESELLPERFGVDPIWRGEHACCRIGADGEIDKTCSVWGQLPTLSWYKPWRWRPTKECIELAPAEGRVSPRRPRLCGWGAPFTSRRAPPSPLFTRRLLPLLIGHVWAVAPKVLGPKTK